MALKDRQEYDTFSLLGTAKKVETMLLRASRKNACLFNIVKHSILPALFFFVMFCLLTFPLMRKFFTDFFANKLDGFVNVWNVWWVNQAVRRPDLYPSIWYTNLLHWPFGTSLRGHTLNPFNGFLGVFLLSFFSLKTTYNTIFIFAFVMAGLTTYWLSYVLTRSYWPSLLAGFLFTFSGYHFAHSSHLNTISLEWIPLFLLCWYLLITRPNTLMGIAGAVVLWLVILCDYYFFFYCILAAVLILSWYATIQKSICFVARREYLISLGIFAVVALLLIGPIVVPLVIGNSRDPLIGAHDPATYSLDLLALLIPGGQWLFRQWTQSYWSRLPGNIGENSVYLALPVFGFLGYLWIKRKFLELAVRQQLYLWSFIMIFFFLLALGPVLHVAGTVVWDKFMPYGLLVRALPFLEISGVPARMTVMVVLSASILSAFSLRELFRQLPQKGLLTHGLLIVVLFQMLPAPLTTTKADVPEYVKVLAGLPSDGGLVDLVKRNRWGIPLYYQTVHGKPITFGYLARIPTSVVQKDEELRKAIVAWDYAKLCGTYHIRYILTSDSIPAVTGQPYISLDLLYYKGGVRIYRLGCEYEMGGQILPPLP